MIKPNIIFRCLGFLLLKFGVGEVAAEGFTLATYNIENYTLADRMTAGGYRKAYPKPESEKTALRQVIKALSADVIALQEMGTRPFLNELQRDLRSEGVDYSYAALVEGPDADRHIAVLSRIPFKRIKPHTNLGFTYFGQPEKVKRGVLEVVFDTSAGELTLFVVHLKSRFTERDDDPKSARRRLGEATAVREMIGRQFAGPVPAQFILAGDFNDTPERRPLEILTEAGGQSLVEMLPTVDAKGMDWTHYYAKMKIHSRVDFMLVSPHLRQTAQPAAEVYDGPGVAQASDHRPVKLTLNLTVVK